RLGLAKQRCLPRAFLLHHEPQDGPPNGLRSLSLVASHHLLVARVLLPLPLLAADLGGVLPALHDCVPFRPGRKRLGHGLLDDLLQGHTGPSPTTSSAARHVALGMVSAPDITLSPSRENLTTCLSATTIRSCSHPISRRRRM